MNRERTRRFLLQVAIFIGILTAVLLVHLVHGMDGVR